MTWQNFELVIKHFLFVFEAILAGNVSLVFTQSVGFLNIIGFWLLLLFVSCYFVLVCLFFSLAYFLLSSMFRVVLLLYVKLYYRLCVLFVLTIFCHYLIHLVKYSCLWLSCIIFKKDLQVFSSLAFKQIIQHFKIRRLHKYMMLHISTFL